MCNLSSEASCNLCNHHLEDTIHTLRDCNNAAPIWNSLMMDIRFDCCKNKPLKEWFTFNLVTCKNLSFGDWNWPVVFAIVCWQVWKWRNAKVFSNHSIPLDKKLETIANIMKEWNEIQSRDKLDKPKGRWLTGFGLNIGNCSIDSAELWVIYHGVKYARQLGMDFVEIESDSNNSVLAIKQGVSINHTLAPLVNAIKELLTNDWHWKIEYIPREKNMAADWLAKWSCNQNRGLHLLCRFLTGLGNIILADCVGVGHPRLVTN
ncbi:hypothetical protein COLO4_22677 [Corchorus olitorius]|uniref:RNase H type-1 domain-containing protein n=1 Tax=Corchorus olitorius TaxID=93759 RepID=A0A1R3IKP1_9ROSI|nr:hypothetical protein COLO4_22677 [Corchorus olitorius]